MEDDLERMSKKSKDEGISDQQLGKRLLSSRDAYFTLFVDIHSGKVFAFCSVT